jgi:hypothetical protein
MSTALTLHDDGGHALAPSSAPQGTWASGDAFALAQRHAVALSSSDLVPAQFAGKPANCLLILELATRLGASPFAVMQNADVIHGRVGLRATFLIACVNASQRFSALRFRFDGAGDARGCTAWARAKDDGEVVEGPRVSIEMAKAEGWATKAGSKWKTMPDLMLSYRAGAFFSRLYASDITLGMHTSDEVEDMGSDRWEPGVTSVTLMDPTREAFNTMLSSPSWTVKQIKSLSTRYANATPEDRVALLANMRTQLAPVEPQDDTDLVEDA